MILLPSADLKRASGLGPTAARYVVWDFARGSGDALSRPPDTERDGGRGDPLGPDPVAASPWDRAMLGPGT
jgi:hypothetical protein